MEACRINFFTWLNVFAYKLHDAFMCRLSLITHLLVLVTSRHVISISVDLCQLGHIPCFPRYLTAKLLSHYHCLLSLNGISFSLICSEWLINYLQLAERLLHKKNYFLDNASTLPCFSVYICSAHMWACVNIFIIA